jgi:hypothetical protein
LEWFLALLLQSIDIALEAPTSNMLERLEQEAREILRNTFDLDALFVDAALAA